mgnify:CR=1 FL=1
MSTMPGDALDKEDQEQGNSDKGDPLLCHLIDLFGLKKKPKEQPSFAKDIDSSIWFNGLYGLLDGISVVYSSIKFSCEVISSTNKEYHENLDHVLTDTEFWLPMIIAITAAAASFSLLGSYASAKKKQGKTNAVEDFCKAWLPYVRDILKGAKNGYKGIKTLIMVLVSHDLLDSSKIRMLALPIGLVFSVAAIINRCYIRIINDKQKAMVKKFDSIAKALKKAHDIELKIQAGNTELFDIIVELAHVQNQQKQNLYPSAIYDKTLPEEEQKTYAEMQKKLEDQQTLKDEELLNLKDTLTRMDLEQYQLEATQQLFIDAAEFQTQYEYAYLFAKGLGGFIDAPYLYLGVMSLATLSFASLILTSSILAFFICVCIAVRVYEGICSQQELSQKALLAKLEQATALFNAKQSEILAMQITHFNQYNDDFGTHAESLQILLANHVAHRLKDGTECRTAIQEGLRELKDLYHGVDLICTNLQKASKPTYQAAILHGMQDGLSAFGVVASSYFLLGIALLIMGQAFPPALIVAGAVFGVVAIAAAIGLRVWQVGDAIIERDKHLDKWKDYISNEISIVQYPERQEAVLLSPLDVNTDYLTKGEFAAQGIFEILRNFLNSTYKAENLTDFFLSHLDGSHTTIITAFWSFTALIYCAVLTLRAYGKTADDKPLKMPSDDEAAPVEKETTTQSLRAAVPPPPAPPPKGIACARFKFKFFDKTRALPEAVNTAAGNTLSTRCGAF